MNIFNALPISGPVARQSLRDSQVRLKTSLLWSKSMKRSAPGYASRRSTLRATRLWVPIKNRKESPVSQLPLTLSRHPLERFVVGKDTLLNVDATRYTLPPAHRIYSASAVTRVGESLGFVALAHIPYLRKCRCNYV